MDSQYLREMVVIHAHAKHLDRCNAQTMFVDVSTMVRLCSMVNLSRLIHAILALVKVLGRLTALTNHADVLTKAEQSTLGLHSTEMNAINVLVCRMDSFNAQTTQCHATASTAL